MFYSLLSSFMLSLSEYPLVGQSCWQAARVIWMPSPVPVWTFFYERNSDPNVFFGPLLCFPYHCFSDNGTINSQSIIIGLSQPNNAVKQCLISGSELLEKLCLSLYDVLRPLIIHVIHLETLSELCGILKNEMLEDHVHNNGGLESFLLLKASQIQTESPLRLMQITVEIILTFKSCVV